MEKISAKSELPCFSHEESNDLPHHSNSDREMENIRTADNLGKVPDFVRQRRTHEVVRLSHGTAGEESGFSSEPLMAYQYDPNLGGHEEVIFTVKTMLQLEKNDHQAELMKSLNRGVFGRDAARPYVWGIVAAFSLAHDRLDWCLAEAKWAFSSIEPYGVAVGENELALATAKSVHLTDLNTGEVKLCHNPWLNQGHTVEFSPDGKKLLVGSSGFDAVFEFDTDSAEVVWEWFAWDHGFDRSNLGHHMVRSEVRRKALVAMGHEVVLVDDPEKYPFGIPTRQKPAHLNSACYDSDGRILVTLFHQGSGYVVDRNTGEAKEVISGLSNPHKLSRRKCGGYFISDTKGGKLILLDEKCRREYEVTLAGMPGVVRSPQLSEFLQNTTEVGEDRFACVDIHRSALWLIDVKRRRYRGIKFPAEWSVHDVASVGRNLAQRIGSLANTQFGKVAAFNQQLKTIHHFSVDGREISALALASGGRHNEANPQIEPINK
jgi:hypothetical protein